MENLSRPTAEPSVAVLLSGIVNDAKNLLKQEVTMFKLEARDELHKAKSAAVTLGIGIGIVTAGGMLLSVMLVQVLAVSTELSLWGCYGLVGSGLVILGSVLLAVGKHKVERLNVVPQQTLETMKETAQWFTERTTFHKA